MTIDTYYISYLDQINRSQGRGRDVGAGGCVWTDPSIIKEGGRPPNNFPLIYFYMHLGIFK